MYRQTGDDGLLRGFGSSFFERIRQEAAMSESAVTSQPDALPELAAKVRAAAGVKEPVVISLLDDLVRTPRPGALTAIFDAVALSLLSE